MWGYMIATNYIDFSFPSSFCRRGVTLNAHVRSNRAENPSENKRCFQLRKLLSFPCASLRGSAFWCRNNTHWLQFCAFLSRGELYSRLKISKLKITACSAVLNRQFRAARGIWLSEMMKYFRGLIFWLTSSMKYRQSFNYLSFLQEKKEKKCRSRKRSRVLVPVYTPV